MRKQIDRIVFDAEVSDRKILLIPAHTLKEIDFLIDGVQ